MNQAISLPNDSTTTASFKTILSEMKQHYLDQLIYSKKSRRMPRFNLTRFGVGRAVELNNDEDLQLQQVMGSSICELQSATAASQAGIQNSVNEASQEYIDSAKTPEDNSEFHHKMDKRRQEALNSSAKVINATFDNAERLGDEFPSLQDGILSVTDDIVSFVVKASKALAKAVTEIVAVVVEALEAAWNFIRDEFAKAASAVGNFFSGIF